MSCATELLLRRSVARNHHPIASLLNLNTKEIISPVAVKRMFELDFNEVKDATGQSLSMDDRRFMAKVTEGIHHRPDSHYELPLPRRDESLALPNNKKLAFHRLQHLKL